MSTDAKTHSTDENGSAPRIRALSHVLSNQIAAGEVIERPASVVKELLENSLDAGAQRIDIEVESAGVRLVRVRDDGAGIHPDDLELALKAHATSKVRSLADLERIESLGFRGEALPSIAAVSRLRLSSRTNDMESGWEISSDGGVIGESQPAAGPRGTVVSVRDLFFNTPARRKFLRTERTELRHIEDIVRRVALSRFDVAFSFQHNGREIFRLSASSKMTENVRRVQRLCGRAFSEHATFVDIEGPDMWLRGWLGSASTARGNTDLQYFFINGRSVKDSTARHAVRQAYDNRIVPGRHPAYVLFLDINPSAVDVNVHPAKQEVRFREARLVHDFIWRNLARGFDDERPGGIYAHVETGTADGPFTAGAPASTVSDAPDAHQYSSPASVLSAFARLQAPAIGGAVVFEKRYAICLKDEGILLVDLQAARSMLVAKALRAATDVSPGPSRPLLLPMPVKVDERHVDLVDRVNDALTRLGFDLRRTAPGALTAHAVPAALAQVPAAALVDAVLEWCRKDKSLDLDKLCETLADYACTHRDDLLFDEGAMASFLRMVEANAEELTQAKARLCIAPDELGALLHRWRG